MAPLASALVGLALAAIGVALLLLGIWAWNDPRGWMLELFWTTLFASGAITGLGLGRLRPNMIWLLAVALPVGVVASLFALPYAWPRISFAAVYYVIFALAFGGDRTDWANSLPRGAARRR